jgi:hypothetical protein
VQSKARGALDEPRGGRLSAHQDSIEATQCVTSGSVPLSEINKPDELCGDERGEPDALGKLTNHPGEHARVERFPSRIDERRVVH